MAEAALVAKLDEIVHAVVKSGAEQALETRSGALIRSVPTYTGESQKGLRKWLRNMERVQIQLEGDASRIKEITLNTLQGAAGDFFVRYIKEVKPQPTWEDIKKNTQREIP